METTPAAVSFLMILGYVGVFTLFFRQYGIMIKPNQNGYVRSTIELGYKKSVVFQPLS